jgi:transposase
VSLYHDQIRRSTEKEKQSKLFPEQLCLFPHALPRPLFSSVYRRKGVQCVQQVKVKAPLVADTTSEADQPNVIAHAEAESTSIVQQSPGGRQGCTMEARQVRGLEIATSQEINREGNVWIVPSQTSSRKYTVNLFLQTCTCLDFESHRLKCKHIYAAEAAQQLESSMQIPVPEKKAKPTYKQEWHEYNLAQTTEKAKFQELLYELCQNIEEPIQHMGRPRVPIADRIFACCFKIYSMLSGRRFMSDLTEAKRRCYLQMMPHYNSIFRYLESKDLTDYLKQLIVESSLPLKTVEFDFTVDSSGFSTGVYQKWSEAKWGGTRTVYGEKKPNEVNRQDWLKVHLMCGVKTNIVTSVEITDAHAGDYPQFAPLVNQTSRNFVMNQVSADKAYSGSKNLQLVLIKGAQPFIDFKSNATANSKDKRQTQVWQRMYHFYSYNREYFTQQYHKRSNVEATFSMIKRKFGERLRSKTHTAQINEVLCKILAHNLCCVIQSMYELGIEPIFWNESIY